MIDDALPRRRTCLPRGPGRGVSSIKFYSKIPQNATKLQKKKFL